MSFDNVYTKMAADLAVGDEFLDGRGKIIEVTRTWYNGVPGVLVFTNSGQSVDLRPSMMVNLKP